MSSVIALGTTTAHSARSVRRATHRDFEAIFGLAQRAYAEGHLGRYPPIRASVFETLKAMEHNAQHILLVAERNSLVVGVLGGVMQPMFHTRKKYATDVFFYVRPEGLGAGLQLARHFIAWARSHRGVREIFMASSSPAVDHCLQDRLYAHLGFTPMGRVFRMEVT